MLPLLSSYLFAINDPINQAGKTSMVAVAVYIYNTERGVLGLEVVFFSSLAGSVFTLTITAQSSLDHPTLTQSR